jgi:integrase
MVYTFARVRAVASLRVEDYFEQGKPAWLRLHEKGGKRREVPCHQNLAAYLDVWNEAADIAGEKKGALFRAIRKGNGLTENPMGRENVLAMIKRPAASAALPHSTCCHTFRATGITTHLQNGATLEHAQQIAAHESPRTTKQYDRTGDGISLNEVERIRVLAAQLRLANNGLRVQRAFLFSSVVHDRYRTGDVDPIVVFRR